MSRIERSIDVHVPVSTAYNQWTQFEGFPKFMEGVESVTQLDDRRLHWVVNLGGQRREWDAEITEQRPDERIAWTTTTGTGNAGVVTFHHLSDTDTASWSSSWSIRRGSPSRSATPSAASTGG